MFKLEMRIDGRKITSNAQLQNEMKRMQKDIEVRMEKGFEDSLKKAAGPGVQVTKTREGYRLQGKPEQVRREKKRLQLRGR